MKNKLLGLLFGLVLLFSLTACGGDGESASKVVNIYNWGEYIDPDLITKFEEETGITVIYSNFTTNEDLYVKLKNGGSNYDLITPSDYMLERMIQEGMVQELNFDNIPNLEYVDAEYLNHTYDPDQEYSVPYFWGTLGIVYNTTMVDEPVISWDILWDEDYARNVIMLDSSRDSLAVALARRGYSLNSRNEEELNLVKEDLMDQYPIVYAYLVDQIKDIMKNDEAALAVMFSGDAQEAVLDNENLDYAIPEEGSNLWFDCFAIPSNAQNKENAELFINFMLDPENSSVNAEYVGYSLPSSAAQELLSDDYRYSEVSYPPPEILENLEVYSHPGDFIEVYDQIWQDVKNQ